MLFEPAGVVLSPAGELIVADSRNNAIRIVRETGWCIVRRVWWAFWIDFEPFRPVPTNNQHVRIRNI